MVINCLDAARVDYFETSGLLQTKVAADRLFDLSAGLKPEPEAIRTVIFRGGCRDLGPTDNYSTRFGARIPKPDMQPSVIATV